MNASHVTIVADLGYGDAGKGSIIDFLARQDSEPPVVVRFNGGPQAAHNVVTPDGRHHTFSQFGSASFLPDARTHLSRFMLVNPLRIAHETDELTALGVAQPQRGLSIDRRALLISPYHEAANRLRELARGSGRHGSCGHGIGETMADWLDHPAEALTAADLAESIAATAKLELARRRKLTQIEDLVPLLEAMPEAARDLATLRDSELSAAVAGFYVHFASHVQVVSEDYLPRLLATTPHTLFEGAQGVLLDEWRGFHPYTTWSTTTFHNANSLLEEANYDGQVTRMGLLRAYSTRHGAGPFVTEDPTLTELVPDPHNLTNDWQQGFRVGHFDLVAARYAVQVSEGVDSLAITCLDRPVARLTATGYRHRGEVIRQLVPGPFTDLDYQAAMTDRLLQSTPIYTQAPEDQGGYLDFLEDALGLPIAIASNGPTADHKRYRLAEAKR
jgi:adenylosuccinate synthase